MADIVWTIDDIGNGHDTGVLDPRGLHEMLDFAGRIGARCTLFMVPKGGGEPITRFPGWVDAVRRAIREGHDVQLHGLEHSAFEFGVPPGDILAYEHNARQRLESERAAIEAGFTRQRLVEKLEEGIGIFEGVTGYRPVAFRSPWLSRAPEYDAALKTAGLTIDSSCVVNWTGWKYIRKDYVPNEWTDIPPHPYLTEHGIIQVPITSEYTWYLNEETVPKHWDLMKDDYLRMMQREDGLFVTLSHQQAMYRENRVGRVLYERLAELAKEHGSRFLTISEAGARIASGADRNPLKKES